MSHQYTLELVLDSLSTTQIKEIIKSLRAEKFDVEADIVVEYYNKYRAPKVPALLRPRVA